MGVPRFTEDQLRAAFFRKVRFDQQTGCWEWQGAKDSKGYGVIRSHGRMRMAHRVIYEWTHGGVLDAMVIRHKCDNPCCVNPAHLVSGSQSDNMFDMHDRNRHPRCGGAPSGERNGVARLTEEKVIALRQRRREGATIAELEAEFGVSEGTIRPALTGKTWGHLPGAIGPDEVKSVRKYATGDRNALGRWWKGKRDAEQ